VRACVRVCVIALLTRAINNLFVEFEGDHLLAQPASFLLAGVGATADVIAYALYNLARQPELQATLYDEIQTHLSGKKLTMDMIAEMFFLDSILIETLRLYPPLPILDRLATKNYEVINSLNN